MSAVADILDRVRQLSPAERAEVWDKLPAVAGRRVVKTAGFCGGQARLDGTRLDVAGLEVWRRMGVSDVRLLEFYPQLTADDLAQAWAYVAAHPDEIEADIRENDEVPPADQPTAHRPT
jgi:uncharacterized protein (DUF433 family)